MVTYLFGKTSLKKTCTTIFKRKNHLCMATHPHMVGICHLHMPQLCSGWGPMQRGSPPISALCRMEGSAKGASLHKGHGIPPHQPPTQPSWPIFLVLMFLLYQWNIWACLWVLLIRLYQFGMWCFQKMNIGWLVGRLYLSKVGWLTIIKALFSICQHIMSLFRTPVEVSSRLEIFINETGYNSTNPMRM